MGERFAGWWLVACLVACSATPPVEPGDGGTGGDDDAGLVDDSLSVGPIEQGWLAPFALDPVAEGLTPSLTWDFTRTLASGTDQVLGSGDFENASRPDAPRSPPGVGRTLMGPDNGAHGGNWSLSRLPALGGPPRRIYFRVMFALSDTYAAAGGMETFFTAAQRRTDGGMTLGQATVHFRNATLDAGVTGLALVVGTRTPNGASRHQQGGPRLTPGRWHQLEALLVAESELGGDGRARVWLDGRRVIDWPEVKWAFEPSYWGGMAFSAQRTTDPEADGGQFRDYDHLELYLSSSRE